jgi:hypothetical protein
VTQPQEINAVPQYQPIQQPEKYLVTVCPQAVNLGSLIYASEKTAAFASTAPQNGPFPCPSPLPQYSSTEKAPIFSK